MGSCELNASFKSAKSSGEIEEYREGQKVGAHKTDSVLVAL